MVDGSDLDQSQDGSDEKCLDSGYVVKAEPKGFPGGRDGEQPGPLDYGTLHTWFTFLVMVLIGLQSIVNQSFWS